MITRLVSIARACVGLLALIALALAGQAGHRWT